MAVSNSEVSAVPVTPSTNTPVKHIMLKHVFKDTLYNFKEIEAVINAGTTVVTGEYSPKTKAVYRNILKLVQQVSYILVKQPNKVDVKGTAHVDPLDTFDQAIGIKLASYRAGKEGINKEYAMITEIKQILDQILLLLDTQALLLKEQKAKVQSNINLIGGIPPRQGTVTSGQVTPEVVAPTPDDSANSTPAI